MTACLSPTPRPHATHAETRNEADAWRSVGHPRLPGWVPPQLPEATQYPHPVGPLPDPPLDRAFLAACVGLERERRKTLTQPAVALVVRIPAPGGGARIETRLHTFTGDAALPAAFVLGSHAECDIARIPGASLRHATLLAMPPLPGDAPLLEAIDLHTGMGLESAGGLTCRRLEAGRAILCGVGSADVLWVGAPAGEPLFPDSVAQTVARGAKVEEAGGDEVEHNPLPASERPVATAHTANVGLPMDEPHFREHTLNASRVLCAAETRPAGVGGTSALYIETDWDTLARGVLLGRYARCEGHPALAAHGGVSRVHALLVVRSQCVWVIDTGSTNGTTIRDSAGNRAELNACRRVGLLRESDEVSLHATRVWVLVH